LIFKHLCPNYPYKTRYKTGFGHGEIKKTVAFGPDLRTAKENLHFTSRFSRISFAKGLTAFFLTGYKHRKKRDRSAKAERSDRRLAGEGDGAVAVLHGGPAAFLSLAAATIKTLLSYVRH
jgi:hypothetical protein